jgi:subtilisin family serine protease
MKEKHIILRVTGAASRGGGFLGGGPMAGPLGGADPTGMSVEIDSMDSSDISRVTRNRDVVCVAPSIPMTLIEPVSTALGSAAAPGAQPAAVGVDWGVHAVGADTSPFTGDGIVVAVLDTGIDSAHKAFEGVTLVRQNFTTDADGTDVHGHGTHCAGTIFGRDVDGTRIGVARGVKKALIGKVIGANGGGSDQIVSAIQWAVNEGANVISMSLGMDFPGFQKRLMQQFGFPPELATSRALEGYRANVLLFERLAGTVKAMGGFGRSTIIIAAAGNESRTDVNPDFKIAVSPPAVSDGVISVAALGNGASGFVVAPFSNTGAMVAGPGVEITSAKRGGGLAAMSGTSMATPHVAGVAALWAQKLKSMGPLNPGLLSTRVVGSGGTTGLAAGFDPVDVGSGMVTAPQN